MEYREKPCPWCFTDDRLDRIIGRYGWVHTKCAEEAGDVDPDEDHCQGKTRPRSAVGVS